MWNRVETYVQEIRLPVPSNSVRQLGFPPEEPPLFRFQGDSQCTGERHGFGFVEGLTRECELPRVDPIAAGI